jgi:hypothetical protein
VVVVADHQQNFRLIKLQMQKPKLKLLRENLMQLRQKHRKEDAAEEPEDAEDANVAEVADNVGGITEELMP